MKRILLTFLIMAIAVSASFGQRVKWNAFRMTEENDFLNLTQHGIDRYYTQGIRFELMYRVKKKGLMEKLMIPAPKATVNQYSVSISQQIYTPGNKDNLKFVGDMPYAGTLYLSQKLESYDSIREVRVTSRLDAGIIGPSAFAKNTQDLFHVLIKNKIAVGWDTQLPDDILLNYSARIEKNISAPTDLMRLELRGEANVGTLLVNAVGGMNFEVGNWYANRKFRWQIFFRPEVRGIVYNALLQGGAIHRNQKDQPQAKYYHRKIEPVVYSHSTGFRMQYKKFGFLYRQVNLSPEFEGQSYHFYGTIMFTFLLGKNPNFLYY